MTKKIDPVRETDAEAIDLAGTLLRETKYGALAVIEPESGSPLVSRVAAAWSPETGLFFCGSDLSVHSKCLLKDKRCSILLGEPGKGDGLAYPRVTLVGTAQRMTNDDTLRSEFREVFVATHPKSELYVDFLDFGFYPIVLERALLNGGFGKAYHLKAEDLAVFAG